MKRKKKQHNEGQNVGNWRVVGKISLRRQYLSIPKERESALWKSGGIDFQSKGTVNTEKTLRQKWASHIQTTAKRPVWVKQSEKKKW